MEILRRGKKDKIGKKMTDFEGEVKKAKSVNSICDYVASNYVFFLFIFTTHTQEWVCSSNWEPES